MAENDKISELLQWQAYDRQLDAERLAQMPQAEWGSTPQPLNEEIVRLAEILERKQSSIGTRARQLAVYKSQPYLTSGMGGAPERTLVMYLIGDLNSMVSDCKNTISIAERLLELLKHG